MSLTVPQVLGSQPNTMLVAGEDVGRQVGSVDQQLSDERSRLDRMKGAWSGAASDAAQSQASAILADTQKYRDTLDSLRQTMTSGAQQMNSIRLSILFRVRAAQSQGWVIGDGGDAAPGPALQGFAGLSPVNSMQIKMMSLQLTSAIKTDLAQFESADRTTADALRKLGQVPDAPPDQSPPPAPPPTPDKQNPADIAKQFLGRNASDLKHSGELPMDPSVPNDVCCANFVTANLQKAGLIDWHSNGVADMSAKLQAQGWHAVPASEAKPGDVAVINGNQHTELVSTNADGKITLIGSNNINPDGSQQISYGHPYGNIVYLTPP